MKASSRLVFFCSICILSLLFAGESHASRQRQINIDLHPTGPRTLNFIDGESVRGQGFHGTVLVSLLGAPTIIELECIWYQDPRGSSDKEQILLCKEDLDSYADVSNPRQNGIDMWVLAGDPLELEGELEVGASKFQLSAKLSGSDGVHSGKAEVKGVGQSKMNLNIG
jgi:hypothetical protein